MDSALLTELPRLPTALELFIRTSPICGRRVPFNEASAFAESWPAISGMTVLELPCRSIAVGRLRILLRSDDESRMRW